MLYFRRVRSPRLRAVTHVDGSARVQSVTAASNPRLYSLLSAFAAQTGLGVLCNTSLNLSRRGFINRMSDLISYCDATGIEDMVVGRPVVFARRLRRPCRARTLMGAPWWSAAPPRPAWAG